MQLATVDSGTKGARGGWKGGVEIAGVENSLSRVDPRGVSNSVVLAEAAEEEDVIRMRPAFKPKVHRCKLRPVESRVDTSCVPG